jgi:G patch domain-containing protein 1
VEDFLDEDELEVARSTTVQANPEFDTFGGTAAEVARRAAAEDAAARPGAVPNLMPDELLVPVADSIGGLLLEGFRV